MPAPKKVPQDHKDPEKKVTNQVQTLVSIEQQRIVLACPKCGQQQINVGVNFCSNCGHPLEWKNIVVIQPPKKEQPKEEKSEAPKAPSKEPSQMN